jgi:hypothetical protein
MASRVLLWGAAVAVCINLSVLLGRRQQFPQEEDGGGSFSSPRAAWLHGKQLSSRTTTPATNNTTHVVGASSSSSSAALHEWRNDYGVVHVVSTRFQQHQPDLLHLGRARLALFEAFCLRTMKLQSSQQFLWIIRAGKRWNWQMLMDCPCLGASGLT